MKKTKIILISIILIITCGFFIWKILFNNETDSATKKIRYPAVAGMFYPDSKYELSKMIEDFLKNTRKEKISGKILGLIVPHAGYIYSGQVAAYSYRQIENIKFESIIIIAPSHYVNFSGAAVYDKGYFRTPLGDVKVDEKLANSLKSKEIFYEESPHIQEHSLEVQIPFLQKVSPSLKIVPIIIGPSTPLEKLESISSIIAKKIKGKNILIIASTDMAHYHPYYENIKIDKRTLSYLEKFDIIGLNECLSAGNCELCGEKPVIVALKVCKNLGANKVKIIKYANSGDVTGDKGRVVGYCAVIILKERKEKKMEEGFLNEKEKKELLKIARTTIEEYITTGRKLEFKITDEKLKQKCGAFVTLKGKEQLRGCIGNIIGDRSLYLTVRDMAIESATGDPRFPPVSVSELDEIEIEISVLSPLKRVKNYQEVIACKHGVVIRKGYRSGVFLPQVAPEQGWNREEFLEALCTHKAGLPKDAYKDKDTELYIFTAEVFGEKE